ncbi:probable 39S ribosomal protein L49, mitochondrial [Thrips palmi]|uniref:Large ribosomal subunit protein mL49 n=1 Tax=Thrips palmi TaxID=161013 RepID=A0A6P9AAL4_THRPL|nr:probable 39S ribosomal protein L49, mitochondrial [Thrips palmi]
MATMKTLSLVTRLGNRSFPTRLGPDLTNKIIPAIHSVPVRYARFKSSPLISKDESQYTGFEISRSPEEWKFVQNLLPALTVPEPKPKPEYPSGWRPQKAPANSVYFIQRTANHMLPVYMRRSGPRGQSVRTVVRYVQGDVWQLERDLRAMLQRVYPDELVITTQVNEVAGQVVVRGDFVSAVREYLLSEGW